MSDDQYPPVMSLRQASAYLGISRAHLSNVINRKVEGASSLQHCRVGRRVLIKRMWANEWLEKLAQETHQ